MRREAREELILVASDQANRSEQINALAEQTNCELDEIKAEMEQLDALLGLSETKPLGTKFIPPTPPVLTPVPFEEIHRAARLRHGSLRDPMTLASADVLRGADEQYRALREQVRQSRILSETEVMVAGLVGLISGLIDTVFFAVPQRPDRLGSSGEGGKAGSNWVKEQLNGLISPEKQRLWEKNYKVSFDAAHSGGLGNKVSGMGPNTHRLHSLGHDPILGFVFGVRDLMTGQMTAVDKFGHVVINQTGNGVPFFEALIKLVMHLASDVTTTRGLPAPFAGLLQFIQIGSFGSRGYTVADISRQMYMQNYDLRHFLALSLPVMLTELLIRVFYLFTRLKQGATLREAMPFGNRPQLGRMLLIGHGVAASWNAGQVIVTQNPLSISAPRWMTLARYALPEVHWQLLGKNQELQRFLDQDWDEWLAHREVPIHSRRLVL